MKKLFLKNGSHIPATATEDEKGKYISFYAADGNGKHKLEYTMFIGKSIAQQKLILAAGVTKLDLWEVELIAEINANFDQYFFNLLNQK